MPAAAEPVTPPATEPDLSRREYVRAVRRITLGLVAIGLAARVVRYAVGAALWGDEAMVGLNLLHRDFAGLARPLDWCQVAPVLFLWAERAVLLVLGSSEWSVRLLPFLAGVAGLLVFWDFARRVVPPTAAALAVGTLAVSRWPVFMSGTLKPYTADLLWSAVLMALAARWRYRPERLWPLVVLPLAVPVALGASYPTVFVAGAVALYLLPAVWRNPDRRVKLLYAAYALLMLGAFAGVYLHVASHKDEPQAVAVDQFMRAYWAHGFPPADPARLPGWLLWIHTGRMMAYPIGDGNGGSTATFLLFLGGVWGCWRSGRRGLLVLCLTPFALNLVAAAMGKYPYGACCRLAQHLAPAVCLLAGVAWADLQEWVAPQLRRRLKWFALAAVSLAAFGLGQIAFDLYRPHHGNGAPWAQRIGRELQRHAGPADRIVVRTDGGVADASFEWYADRLGDQVTHELPTPPGPETRRVWVVVIGANWSQRAEEDRVRGALGPGWASLARTEYVLPIDTEPGRYLRCTLHCLARPGDTADPPLLRSSP